MKRRGSAFATAIVVAVATILAVGPAESSRWAGAWVPGEYRTWRVVNEDGSKQTVSQFSFPVASTLHLAPGMDLVVSTAFAFTQLESSGQLASPRGDLGGASDLDLQVFKRIFRDRIALTAGVGIPSGKTELSEVEVNAVGALSRPTRGFQLRAYGNGLVVRGGVAIELPLRSSTYIAIGSGIVLPGQYTLELGNQPVRPGQEFAFTLGIRATRYVRRGFDRSLRVTATYRLYGADEVGGTSAFEEGNQMELAARLGVAGRGVRLSWQNQIVAKQANTRFRELESGFFEALKRDAGRSLFSVLRAETRVSDSVRAGLMAEWRNFAGSEDQARDGNSVGIGPTLSLRVGSANRLALELLYLSGTEASYNGNANASVSGYSIGFSYRLLTSKRDP